MSNRQHPNLASLASLAIAEFNFMPSRYIHTSWLPQTLQDLIALAEEQGPAHHTLSKHLLGHYHLSDNYDFDFSNKLKHIALLRPDRLHYLYTALGFVLNATVIQKVISGIYIRRIKSVVGQDIYTLVAKAPLFVLRSSTFTVYHVPLPGATRPTRPADTGDDEQAWQAWLVAIHQAGMRLLAAIFSSQPPAFIQRLCFKSPKQQSEIFSQARDHAQQQPALGKQVLLYTLKEIKHADIQALTN